MYETINSVVKLIGCVYVCGVNVYICVCVSYEHQIFLSNNNNAFHLINVFSHIEHTLYEHTLFKRYIFLHIYNYNDNMLL